MRKETEKEIWEQGLFKIYDFVKNSKFSKVSAKLMIDGWHPIAQIFFYFFLIGAILVTLTIFFLPWYIMWIYVIIWIVSLGFIFAKPGQKYRITYVFSAFLVLIFLVSFVDPLVAPMLSFTEDEEKEFSEKYNDLSEDYSDEELVEMGLEEFSDAIDISESDIESYAHAEPNDFETAEAYEAAVIRGFISEVKGYEDDEAEERASAYDFTNLWDEIRGLDRNPFANIESWLDNLFDVLNWIVFLACVLGVGTVVGATVTLQFDKAVQRGVAVAIAVTFMVAMYSIFSFAGIQVKTVWDTVGDGWETMLASLGLTELNQQGEDVLTVSSVHTGVVSLIPLIIVLISLGLAVSLRHTAFNSIMYIKSLKDDGMIEINRQWKIKPSIVAMLLIVVVAMAGYILTVADPIDSVGMVPLMFFIGSIVILLLIGTNVLVLNEKTSAFNMVKRTCLWTLYGVMLLYMWFLVFQPIMFEMNLIGDQSGMISLSQEQELLETSLFEQFFTVAMPETLIFQIAFVGVFRRIFFQIGKGRELDLEDERLKEKRGQLLDERRKVRKIIVGSKSKENFERITKYVYISQEIDFIRLQLKEKARIPFRKVLFSGLFGAVIGSFFFSFYHSFRRGYAGWQGLIDWWQDPMMGMTYFGAGMMLSLVAMFSYPAAILVHYINNIFSMWMGGTL